MPNNSAHDDAVRRHAARGRAEQLKRSCNAALMLLKLTPPGTPTYSDRENSLIQAIEATGWLESIASRRKLPIQDAQDITQQLWLTLIPRVRNGTCYEVTKTYLDYGMRNKAKAVYRGWHKDHNLTKNLERRLANGSPGGRQPLRWKLSADQIMLVALAAGLTEDELEYLRNKCEGFSDVRIAKKTRMSRPRISSVRGEILVKIQIHVKDFDPGYDDHDAQHGVIGEDETHYLDQRKLGKTDQQVMSETGWTRNELAKIKRNIYADLIAFINQ